MNDDTDTNVITDKVVEQSESLDDDCSDRIYNPLGISDDDDDDKAENGEKQDVSVHTSTTTRKAANLKEEPTVSVKENKQKNNKIKESQRNSQKLRKLMKTAIGNAKSSNSMLFELPKSYQTNPYNFPGQSNMISFLIFELN